MELKWARGRNGGVTIVSKSQPEEEEEGIMEAEKKSWKSEVSQKGVHKIVYDGRLYLVYIVSVKF